MNSQYRNALPQLSGEMFLTDGGLETTLIFHDEIELPEFAAFDLLNSERGYERLKDYFLRYARIAQQAGVGFILESPTWRASAQWADRLGFTRAELDEMNKKSIALLEEVRAEVESKTSPMVISGCVGPRGDGYVPTDAMSAKEAQQYHSAQIKTFSDSAADMVSAVTMNYVEEAIGIVRAAVAYQLPVVISFTVETDGRLPTGQTLQSAIEEVDAATGNAPAYYMINCAHPTHFAHVLDGGGEFLQRIRGVRANASCKSHAELDESETLDDGNPHELGEQYVQLTNSLRNANVFGGCCGTDHRHVEAICEACLPHFHARARVVA